MMVIGFSETRLIVDVGNLAYTVRVFPSPLAARDPLPKGEGVLKALALWERVG